MNLRRIALVVILSVAALCPTGPASAAAEGEFPLRRVADSAVVASASPAGLSLSVEAGGLSSIAVSPGAVVTYQVVGLLGDDNNQGLALIGFDLDFDGADLAQADTPTGDPSSGCENPMIHFTLPWGITNPAGFGGTVVNGNLIQVGGGQNTTNNSPDHAPYPIGTVLPGVAQPSGCGASVLATGALTAPLLPGNYTLALRDAFANVITAGTTGVPFWATQAAAIGSVRNLTLTVGVDCNGNYQPDACDIDCDAGACDTPCGTSLDCNGNQVPDECEPDCNHNGIADVCELRDCPPGERACADCNQNGVPDGCEAGCDNPRVVVSLVPSHPGLYNPGESLSVDVTLAQIPPGRDILLRLVQLDFSAGDPAIVRNAFAFDYSAQSICQSVPSQCGNVYADFPSLIDGDGAVVTTVFTGTSQSPLYQIRFPSTGTITVGRLSVTLPTATGTYLLDAMNPGSPNPNSGALLIFGFGESDPRTDWWVGNGDLVGTPLLLEVGCPSDPDSDGVCGTRDNCPWLYNPLQEDRDGDGVGDACDDTADIPPVFGYIPYIAIATSDERSAPSLGDYEHHLRSAYSGNPLVAPVSENFVVGVLGTGSAVHWISGSSALKTGLTGSMLTTNAVPIGGVGGSSNALVTYPLGIFTAGLSAMGADGVLDVDQLVGHSNVAMLAAAPVDCDAQAIVGTPLLAFWTTLVNVDDPRTVTINGQLYEGPAVRFQSLAMPLSGYAHQIPLETGGASPVSTASYYPELEELETPSVPTMLSVSPYSVPTGGAFFVDIEVTSSAGTSQAVRALVDTASRVTLLHPNVASSLGLALEPDFVVDLCGVGGLMVGMPGYVLENVRIRSADGHIDVPRAPVIVADLPSPEGGALEAVIGTNLLWNRNIAIQPSLSGTGVLHVSDAIVTAGACCATSGCLDDHSESTCEAIDGLWYQGTPCATVLCPDDSPVILTTTYPSADGTLVDGAPYGPFDGAADTADWTFNQSSFEGAILRTPDLEHRLTFEYTLAAVTEPTPVGATLTFTLRGAPRFPADPADVAVYSYPADLLETLSDFSAAPSVFRGRVAIPPYSPATAYSIDVTQAVNHALATGVRRVGFRFQIEDAAPASLVAAYMDALDSDPSTKPRLTIEQYAPSTAACCTEAECANRDYEACDALGGTWYGHQSCASITCPASVQSPPTISALTAGQRDDGSGLVDVYYDLADDNGDSSTIAVAVSDADGLTWSIPIDHLNGDIGPGVVPDVGRYFVWSSAADLPGRSGMFTLLVTADDGQGNPPSSASTLLVLDNESEVVPLGQEGIYYELRRDTFPILAGADAIPDRIPAPPWHDRNGHPGLRHYYWVRALDLRSASSTPLNLGNIAPSYADIQAILDITMPRHAPTAGVEAWVPVWFDIRAKNNTGNPWIGRFAIEIWEIDGSLTPTLSCPCLFCECTLVYGHETDTVTLEPTGLDAQFEHMFSRHQLLQLSHPSHTVGDGDDTLEFVATIRVLESTTVANTPELPVLLADALPTGPTIQLVANLPQRGIDVTWSPLPTSDTAFGPASSIVWPNVECVVSEECVDGHFCNGVERCANFVCRPGITVSCNDSLACTIDACDEAADTCTHDPVHARCDDGLYCNGVERCDSALGCIAGAPPNCDDGIACTVDSCNESTDSCGHSPRDELCDNGLFCDGAEWCDATRGCRDDSPPDCNDFEACTLDACDEATDACVNLPIDATCDNGLFCDGVEYCHALLGCRSGAPPCPPEFRCDEISDQCLPCMEDADCADADACNGAERCIDSLCQPGTPPSCDNGVFCDGTESCDPLRGCIPGFLDCGDGVDCTRDECDEPTRTCRHASDDAACDDGVFCNGRETCSVDIGCVSAGDPCQSRGLVCDEAAAACTCNSDADCRDSLFCNGDERCASGICSSSGDPCVAVGSVCVESARRCEHFDPLLGEAVDAPDLIWSTGGIGGAASRWRRQLETTHDGEDAAVSGDRSAPGWIGGHSWIQTAVVGPGDVSFWWTCGTAVDGASHQFLIDHNLRAFHEGDAELPWTLETHRVDAGVHFLEWVTADGFVGGGSPCILDEVRVAPVVLGGPDIVVADLQATIRFAPVGDITPFGIGPTACNLGTERASCDASGNEHFVFIQNLYRLKDDVFEQIGMSWMWHEFHCASQDFCGPCGDPTDGSQLGVGCSSPDSPLLTALPSRMTPRSTLNAHTGEYPYPWTGPAPTSSIDRRLQVPTADLDPLQNPGARYFIEGQFVSPGDAAAGTADNNASYREVTVSTVAPGVFSLLLINSLTAHRGDPAIRAWSDIDSQVEETEIRVPGEGLFFLSARSHSLGTGWWRYTYALHNLNSDRSARTFAVPLTSGAIVNDPRFHDVDYHSGEPYDPTDWTPTVSPSAITWSTADFAADPNANALRFGTLYAFSFEADAPPQAATARIGLFKPGPFASVLAATLGPGVGTPPECLDHADCDDADVCTEDFCLGALCRFLPLTDCCVDDTECDDQQVCTVDECVDHRCSHRSDPGPCDDGLFCNGSETCSDCPPLTECCFPPGICIPDFPRQTCLELGGTPACDDYACEPGTPPCDDGIECTVDTCDEEHRSCSFLPDASRCADEVECTIDLCDPTLGCRRLFDHRICDDGLFCNGKEHCTANGCAAGRLPCPGRCDERTDRCRWRTDPQYRSGPGN